MYKFVRIIQSFTGIIRSSDYRSNQTNTSLPILFLDGVCHSLSLAPGSIGGWHISPINPKTLPEKNPDNPYKRGHHPYQPYIIPINPSITPVSPIKPS